MRIVKCRVADEYVVGDNVVVGAAGSHNDVALMLEFSPLWDGTTKQIVWHDALGENPIITILTVDMVFGTKVNTYVVPIPVEPKAKAGEMTMTIKGTIVDGDKEQSATMSATAKFRILPSSWDNEAEQTQDITPSQAVQLQQQLDKVIGTIVDIDGAVEAAKEAAELAVDAAEKAVEAVENVPTMDKVNEAIEEAIKDIPGGGTGTGAMTVIDLTASVAVDSSASAYTKQAVTADIGMTGDELYELWLQGPVVIKYKDNAASGTQSALVTAIEQTEGSAYEVYISAANAKTQTIPAVLFLLIYPESAEVGGFFVPVAGPMPSWEAAEGSPNYIYGKPDSVVQTVNGVAPDASGNVTVKDTQGPAGPAGADGADGYTPVKGVDYYTEAEKTELVNEVLAQVESDPAVTAIHTVLSGTTITTTETLEDGSTNKIVVTLDENGVPIGMTANGAAVDLTMEGF